MKRSILVGIIFGILGFTVNWFKLELFFNVDFLFGSICVMLALLLAGGTAGLIAGVIAAFSTWLHWRHPWAVIIFTSEIAFVAWRLRRGTRNLVISDICFWLCLGAPLVWLCYHQVMGISAFPMLLIALKQGVNGITNTLLATMIWMAIRLVFDRDVKQLPSFREVIFTTTMGLVLFPALLYLVVDQRQTFRREQDLLAGEARHTAVLTRDTLQWWLDEHLGDVETLAAMVGDPNQRPRGAMQQTVETIHRFNPRFVRMGVFDWNALSVAYSPPAVNGTTTLGLDYSDRPYLPALRAGRKPMIPDLVMGRIGRPAPVIPLVAPVLNAGEYRGFCSGVIDPSEIGRILTSMAGAASRHLTVLDRNGLVISSTRPERRIGDRYRLPDGGSLSSLGAGASLWVPGIQHGVSVITRWEGAWLLAEAALAEKSSWKVIAELSLLPMLTTFSDKAVNVIGLMSILLMLTTLLAQHISSMISDPVGALREWSGGIPARIRESEDVRRTPFSNISEVNDLIGNIEEMEQELRVAFRSAATENERLEARVEERTRELLHSAEELRASDENFRTFFDSIDHFLFVLDQQGNIIKVNRTVIERLGYSKEELYGRNVLMIHPEARRSEAGGIVEAMLTGTADCCPVPLIRKDGSLIPVETRVAPGRWNGQPALFGVTKDISALQHSEEKFAKAFHLNPALMAISTLEEGTYLDVNEAFLETLGFSRDEVIGMSSRALRILTEEQRALMQESMAEGKPVRGIVVTVKSKAGETRHGLFSADIINVQEQRLLITLMVDITSQVVLTEQLDRERRFLRTLLDAIPDMIFIKDAEGVYLGCNDAFAALYARRPQEWVVGRSDLDFGVNEELVELCRRMDREALETESPQRFEAWIPLEDGRLICTELLETPYRERDGRIIGIIGVSRDVTERKQAEEELRNNAAWLEALKERSPIGILVTNLDRIILDTNPAFCAMFGYTHDELVGQASRIIHVSDETCREFGERLYFDIKSGQQVRLEYRIRKQSGEIFWGDIAGQAIDPTNPAKGTIWKILDITEKKKLEHELLVAMESAAGANRAKSEFLANMSHEIRTPMNAVIGLGRLLMETDLSPRQREYLGKINSSAHLLLGVINDILDLSKVEAGKLTLEQVAFNLPGCLEKVADVIAVQAHAKGLAFRTRIAPGVPEYVTGDPLRLRQVLLNLLGNAVKFTESGKVGLSVASVESEAPDRIVLEFQVSDTGIGLSLEQCLAIFEPFAQGDSSTTRSHGGTGLGLSISKRLVELMGGSVYVEGEPGRGSVFTFTAGFAPAASADLEATPLPASRDLRSIHGARVLVVEDNPINQQITRLQLTKIGIRVMTANDGREALDIVARVPEPFDLALMDIQMPVMDGYEATRLIRLRHGPEELPIVAMTAHALPEERQRCLDAGMNDHLSKPFEVVDLHEKLLRWIKPRSGRNDSPEETALILGETSAASPRDIPELTVLRAEQTLARLGGDRDFYRELLLQFVQENRRVADQLGTLLDAGEHDAALSVAHTLKGVAGNLGAAELAAMAAAMETALRQGGAPEARTLVAPLAERLDQALVAIVDFTRDPRS